MFHDLVRNSPLGGSNALQGVEETAAGRGLIYDPLDRRRVMDVLVKRYSGRAIVVLRVDVVVALVEARSCVPLASRRVHIGRVAKSLQLEAFVFHL